MIRQRTNFRAVAGIGLLMLVTMLLSGCASSSIFTSYPSRLESVRQSVAREEFQKPYDRLEDHADSQDKLLYLMEMGRVAQLAGQWETSAQNFARAIAVVEQERREAKVSLTQQVGGALLNDNAIPYRSRSYEVIFIHTYQAINYLAMGQLENAQVALRAAQNEQVYASQRHEEEITEAEQAAQQQRLRQSALNESMSKSMSWMEEATAGVKSSFLNAFTYYLSGVVWEMAGEPDNAFAAYKNAWGIEPQNPYVHRALARLAPMVAPAEAERFASLAGASGARGSPSQGRLVVIYDDGLVPPRAQTKVPLVWNNIVYTIAMPHYRVGRGRGAPLKVNVEGSAFPTSELTTVRGLAVKDLEERFMPMLTRQAIRGLGRHEVQSKIEDDYLRLAVGLLSYATENADTRSWLTLPDNVQVAEIFVSPGRRTLRLDHAQAGSQTLTATFEAGETKLLYVARPGHTLIEYLLPPEPNAAPAVSMTHY